MLWDFISNLHGPESAQPADPGRRALTVMSVPAHQIWLQHAHRTARHGNALSQTSPMAQLINNRAQGLAVSMLKYSIIKGGVWVEILGFRGQGHEVTAFEV